MANPAMCMFDEYFVVRNGSTSSIQVTPIGHFPTQSARRVIPQRWGPGFALPPLGDAHRIGPGQSTTITYDSDDIVLSEFVVESEAVPGPRVLPVLHPHRQGFTFVVDELAALPAARQEHLYGASSYTCWRTWALLFAFVIPFGFLAAYQRANRRAFRS